MPTPPPPVHSRFKAGQSGNPGGKTRQQRQIEIENAKLATEIRSRLLDALMEKLVVADGDHDAVMKCIEANTLRLLKDAEDRGFGAPKAAVEISGDDPQEYHRAFRAAVLEALERGHGVK